MKNFELQSKILYLVHQKKTKKHLKLKAKKTRQQISGPFTLLVIGKKK